MEDIALEVSHVSKLYKLYKTPGDRFKESLGLSRKKRYREVYALDDVNFSVKRGECVGIIGTNGSGKSTILKIITGVLTPSQGEVRVNGRISALLELGAGFNQEYTGMENIYLNGTVMGFTKEEIDARVEDIIKFADIGEFINQPVKTYSSGMFVRLAFAVAINIEPEILIVDEALSVGDVFFQSKCYHKFDEFKQQGKTILLVSHDLSSVAKYCDRVILLNKGVKLEEGEPKKMVDLYKKVLVNLAGNDEEEKSLDKAMETDEDGKRLLTDNKVTGPLDQNPDMLEYGEGQASIYEVYTEDENGTVTGTLEKGRPFRIRMKVRFNEDVREPIFAYTFKNIRGTEITGTNSMFEKIPVGDMKKGEAVELVFTQTMNLQGGEYLLSFGCTGFTGDTFRVFHRLYDVLNVSVMAEQNTVGYYDMFSKIEFHKTDGEAGAVPANA